MLADKYPVEDYDGPGERPEQQVADIEEESTIPIRVSSRWRGARCYIGEPVAAVVATSKAQAADAAAAVEVEYDALEAVVDPYEARQPGAPQLYDEVKNNVSVRQEAVHGNVDAALEAAPVKVKAKIAPRCHPMPMETRGVLAAPTRSRADSPSGPRTRVRTASATRSPAPSAWVRTRSAPSRRKLAAASAANSVPITRTLLPRRWRSS